MTKAATHNTANTGKEYYQRILADAFFKHWKNPDRRPIYEWAANGHIRLPHSARSKNFSIDISPWLREPMSWINDGTTRELSMVGAVQGAKTTLTEVAFPYWISNDPGPVMWNYQTDPDAFDAVKDRIYPVLRASPATRHIVEDLSKMEMSKGHLTLPFMFAVFQGAHARSNLQSKSIRYLINDEAWMYPPGNLAEAYKRVTAFWNSLIINLCTGGEEDCEMHEVWKASTQHKYHVKCPHCNELFFPKFERPTKKGEAGGMRWDRKLKRKDGTYNMTDLAKTIYLQCPINGCEIKDTPHNRNYMSSNGDYVQSNKDAFDWRKGATFNFAAVPWVPFETVVDEFMKSMTAVRYGDETLLKEFVQKRLAEFWDPNRHRPAVANVKTVEGLKMNQGIPDRTFRAMSIDCQLDHYWVLIRDWHKTKGSRLVYYEKVETHEEARSLQQKYKIKDRFVMIDAADRQARVLRIASQYGWTCVRGSDRDSFLHILEDRKVHRLYSPLQFMDPFVGTKKQNKVEVGLFFFSKYAAFDRLAALRNGEIDYPYEVPEDIGDDYRKQLDSWEKRERIIERTGIMTMEWIQIRKHDHLRDCEIYQIILASVCGLIGSEKMEQENNA
jgi:phage terminase large subunit GpA-like protein